MCFADVSAVTGVLLVVLQTLSPVTVAGRADPSYLDHCDAEEDEGLWVPLATTQAPSRRWFHTAVWTGTEMIVWGGQHQDDARGLRVVGDGGRYNPAADQWQGVSGVGAPAPREEHTAVWTGSEMIIWGGRTSTGLADDGARYDARTDTWQRLSGADRPAPRSRHIAFWTGSEMLIWGGMGAGGSSLISGGRYDPVADAWSAMSEPPGPASQYTLVGVGAWTGEQLLIWGPLSGLVMYDPVSDDWTVGSPDSGLLSGRFGVAGVLANQELILWGGEFGLRPPDYADDGAAYNHTENSWRPMAAEGAPSPRSFPAAVWTGSEMIVWGGAGPPRTVVGDGARYDPDNDTWRPVTVVGAPSARRRHQAVWAGDSFLVWGGNTQPDVGVALTGDGGRYFPPTSQGESRCDRNRD
jgi:hypothetical protein